MIDAQKRFEASAPKAALVVAKAAAQGSRSVRNCLYRALPDTAAQMIVDARTEIERAAKPEKNA